MFKIVYHPYHKWEDYLNGMYDIPKKPYDDLIIKNCVKLLSNEDRFFKTGLELINNWVVSSEHNLSNKSINRQSWIGQASCSFKYKAPELLTRIAWSEVKPLDRIRANKIADKITRIYEIRNREIYKGVEEKGLF